MNVARLVKTIVGTRATADCVLRGSPSALAACEWLARESSAAATAGGGDLLDIKFNYQYCIQRYADYDENQLANHAIKVAKKCLKSARLRCATTAGTLDNMLSEDCVGLCCFEDLKSKTTHLAAANNSGEFLWRLSMDGQSAQVGGATTAGAARSLPAKQAHLAASREKNMALFGGCDPSHIRDIIVFGLAAALQIEASSCEDHFNSIPLFFFGESLDRLTRDSTSDETLCHPIDALLHGRVQHVIFSKDGWDHTCVDMPLPPGVLVFPGSFNPLHYGHREAIDAAMACILARGERVSGHAFEISAEHPDKGLLQKEEIRARVEQFTGVAPVIVSRAALYVEKAERYHSSRLLVGTDVMQKILHPQYSGGSTVRMNANLERIRLCGCSFLVAGRKNDATGEFETAECVLRAAMSSVEDQAAVRDMFIPIEGFRADVSSTRIRAELAVGKL